MQNLGFFSKEVSVDASLLCATDVKYVVKINLKGDWSLVGALAADALSMPVHWYYDRAALGRDYGRVSSYVAPKSPHADSILWRSEYQPLNEKGNILHEQAVYWGRKGVHYHQFLHAAENTLNFQLAVALFELVKETGSYNAEAWVERYCDFMLTPGRHRDTYVEECHRAFFTNYARGKKWHSCGVDDVHIGGLASVPALVAALGPRHPDLRAVVQEHVEITHKNNEVLRAADTLVRLHVAIDSGALSLEEALFEEASDYISRRKVVAWSKKSDEVVIGEILSPACYIKDAFPAALYLAWKYQHDFSGGIIANANLGGDNCHRGAVVGSLLGAACKVPLKWRAGLRVLQGHLKLEGSGMGEDCLVCSQEL